MKRRKLSNGRRYRILQRDGFRCRYCGAQGADVQLHVDHIHPVSAGGTNDPHNLVTACSDCNLGKHTSLPTWEPCIPLFHEDGNPLDDNIRDTLAAAARLEWRRGYEETGMTWETYPALRHQLRARVDAFEQTLAERIGADGTGIERCTADQGASGHQEPTSTGEFCAEAA